MKQTWHPIVILAFLLALGCQKKDYKQMASEACACLAELDSLNLLLEVALVKTDQDALIALLTDLSAAATPAQQCLHHAGLPDLILIEQTPELKQELDLQCTQWKALMESLPDRQGE